MVLSQALHRSSFFLLLKKSIDFAFFFRLGSPPPTLRSAAMASTAVKLIGKFLRSLSHRTVLYRPLSNPV
jgi:hypothetical protein